MFALITALVIISGYLVTCDELHYEARRQVLGRIGQGKLLQSETCSIIDHGGLYFFNLLSRV